MLVPIVATRYVLRSYQKQEVSFSIRLGVYFLNLLELQLRKKGTFAIDRQLEFERIILNFLCKYQERVKHFKVEYALKNCSLGACNVL